MLLKLICKKNVSNFEFPTFVLCKYKRFCLQMLQTRFQCFIGPQDLGFTIIYFYNKVLSKKSRITERHSDIRTINVNSHLSLLTSLVNSRSCDWTSYTEMVRF